MGLSEEITVAAAARVVEDGMEYGAAKRRAARDLGRRAVRSVELPSNEAVEAAVREHLAIFCADTQPAELRALRELACVWMERLAEFRPHLAGAAWRGTATRRSALHIDLYCDDSKAAEIHFLNLGIRYDVDTLDHGAHPVDVLTVSERCSALGEPVTLHFAVRDHDDVRGALRHDPQGRSWRGDLAALRRLLATGGNP